MTNFSRFLSVLFHPVFMVTYAALIFYFLIPSDFNFDPAITWRILGMLFISTVLIPCTALFFMAKTGAIKSVRIEEQKERNWPLLLGAIIYFTTFYIMQHKGIPVYIQLFLLGGTLGIIISLLVNLRWKISLHMIGAGGVCGGTTMLMLLQQSGSATLLTVLFLITGLLGTARLHLNAHTPAQVFAGFLTGFAVQFILLLIMVG